jgi:hypothetical protein
MIAIAAGNSWQLTCTQTDRCIILFLVFSSDGYFPLHSFVTDFVLFRSVQQVQFLGVVKMQQTAARCDAPTFYCSCDGLMSLNHLRAVAQVLCIGM